MSNVISKDQIEYMVDRFLSWTLPENLHPDGGISFQRSESAAKYNHPWPTGTNFLDAFQAEQMVRHMVRDLPEREGSKPIQVPYADVICSSCGKTDRPLWPEGCNNVWHREGVKITPDLNAVIRTHPALDPMEKHDMVAEVTRLREENAELAQARAPFGEQEWNGPYTRMGPRSRETVNALLAKRGKS